MPHHIKEKTWRNITATVGVMLTVDDPRPKGEGVKQVFLDYDDWMRLDSLVRDQGKRLNRNRTDGFNFQQG